MKSVKPGRGPSAMGAFGSVIGVIFGVIWTGAAASMGAPPFFLAFGVLFIIVGIVQAAYNLKNATGENRFSEYDITEDGEEPPPEGAYRFCPYCGAKFSGDFLYCGKCGKRLPDLE